MVAGGAGRYRCGLLLGLGFAFAIGGAYLYSMLAGAGIPIVDPESPSVHVQLSAERCLVPGLAVVGGDLDPLYAPGGRPSYAADPDGAGGHRVSVLYSV